MNTITRFDLIPSPAIADKGKPFCTVKKGSIEIPIYKDADGRFTIAWYESGRRKRTRRADLKKAKEVAGAKAIAMGNGQTYMLGMTEADRATLKRVMEILLPTGKSPELAASEYAEAMATIKVTGATLGTVCTFYVQTASRANIVPKTCPEIVDEFLEIKAANRFGKKAGARWLRTLTKQLDVFKNHFQGPVSELTSDKLDCWLQGIKMPDPKSKDRRIPISSSTVKGYRTAVSGLVTYAKHKRYLDPKWDELDRVNVPEASKPTKRIYRPEELDRLLTCAPDKLVPFIVVGAFAGIRHEEINPERNSGKEPLDWRDFDFDAGVIKVREETAKKGEERYIKMTDNLRAWLAPYRRLDGPICTVANTANALTRTKRKAGLPAGKGETRNSLRKSWVSYSAALNKDQVGVTDEAGHSQAISKRNYQQAQREAEAKRWFALRPLSLDVLPLEFALK